MFQLSGGHCHKPDQPIRPVLNWRNAPAYKLPKLFTQKVGHLAPLPNAFNVEDSKDLIHKLNHTPILPHFHLASLDITNKYTNIPIAETQTMFANILKQNLVDPQTQQELMKWYETISKQNYFSYNNILIQKEGLAVGAPSSSLIAEIFLQHTKYQQMAELSTKHIIINYFLYVDDILIIFDPNHYSIQTILAEFKTLHTKLQFTVEVEKDNTINYLDVNIHRTPSDWKTAIYRKPTFTGTIIPYTPNHPLQHKYAALRFLCNRLHAYNRQNTYKKKTLSTTFSTTVSFQQNHINPNHKNSDKMHTHKHKNGPRLLTL